MYWGSLDNNTTFRVWKWNAWQNFATTFVVTISPSTFSNPDCRGGVGNNDFIERSTAWSITGFRMRGAVSDNNVVTFWWNVGADSAHPQGHVHAVAIRAGNKKVFAQPHIWSSSLCFGFPVVGTNERGDYGLSIAAGGRRGGGGTAAQGFVAIDDGFTPGFGVFQTVFLTASGTHNRSDGRYGDYFTCHAHEPCDLFFNATNYSLNGGTGVGNVNCRYIEFGRGQNKPCYDGWSDENRIP